MNGANQYAAPTARLEREEDGIYGEVRPFSPRGRLGRIRYLFYSMVLWMSFFLIAGLLLLWIGAEAGFEVPMVFLGASVVALTVFQVILMIQRCHDFNATGWLSLLALVPFIGPVFHLFLLFMPGTDAANGYGPPPSPNQLSMTVVAVGLLVSVFIGGILVAIAIPSS